MTEARYLYCIADGNREITLGTIGIANNEVHTIPYKDLCAVVHNCPQEPYKSEDKEKVKAWIVAHERVIEIVWERFETVLPLGFDTIIRGEQEGNAEDNIKKWLKDDYENLRNKLDKLRAKAEYGVQIFWDFKIIARVLVERNGKIKELNEEIKSKSKGLAYMYKQKLENLLKKQMDEEAEKYFKDIYMRVKKCVDEIKIEKTKKSEEGKQMLMNFSCLLSKEKSKTLGEELENINKRKEFSVRFTGPWPPYSFV